MGLREQTDALVDRVTGSVGAWVDGVYPLTFSDDRGKEARKAVSSFILTYTLEFGLMATTGALAAWFAHYSPDAALLIEHGGNWVEMAVLLTGAAVTLSHGFMAGHP